MCLILFAHQIYPQYPLVVAANRDEFFGRETRSAQFWEDENQGQVLAGKDLVLGGTWLGVNQQGRFAAVTNVRDPSAETKKPLSRGELTLNFLTGDLEPMAYLNSLYANRDEYAGYNLLVGDGRELAYLNNQGATPSLLQPGVYGLSNALLDSPWPKVISGRNALKQCVEDGPSTDKLLQLMADRGQAEEEVLPETGVSRELEKVLSSRFIHNPQRNYGTRCSTALIVDENNFLRFSEQNYDSEGSPQDRSYFEFPLRSR